MTDSFQLRVDPRAVSNLFDRLSNQYPFAVSKWLNALANDGQAAQRGYMRSAFTMRRLAWNIQGVKIEKLDRATKTSWRVIIRISDDRNYLDKFESLGYHLPFRGKYVWIPNPAVFGNKIIERTNPLHPKNLAFQPFRGGMERGNESTYMIQGRQGPLVFQRLEKSLTKASRKIVKRMTLNNFAGGQGPRTKKERYSLSRTAGTRLVWSLVQRVTVPLKLEFVPTITREVNAMSQQRWNEAMAYAKETAK